MSNLPRCVVVKVDSDSAGDFLIGTNSEAQLFLKSKPPYDGMFVPWANSLAGFRDAYRIVLRSEVSYVVFTVAKGHPTIDQWLKMRYRLIGSQWWLIEAYTSNLYPREMRILCVKVTCKMLPEDVSACRRRMFPPTLPNS